MTTKAVAMKASSRSRGGTWATLVTGCPCGGEYLKLGLAVASGTRLVYWHPLALQLVRFLAGVLPTCPVSDGLVAQFVVRGLERRQAAAGGNGPSGETVERW